MDGLYADPALYDILYTPGTAAEVDALERLEARFGASRRRDRWWFEPACGTGRYLRVAAGRGRRVAGCDLEEAPLVYARRRTPAAARRLFRADMTACAESAARAGLPVGRVPFAFNPVNSLRHLPGDAAVARHLQEMGRILAPGGLYVVGLSLVDYGFLFPEEDVWRAARGSCRVTQLVNYLPPEPGTRRARVETVVSHLTVTRPRGEEHFDTTYDLHCLDRAQWRRVVHRGGLEHVASCDHAGHDLDDRTLPYQLEVLRRPV